MMLYEEGAFLLDDPISKFVPAFAATKVATQEGTLEDLDRPITFRHLLTHTSGLTYSFIPDELGVSKYYKEHSIQFASTEIDRQSGHPVSLEEMVERIAKAPLCFQPGAEWRYSHATDVLGYLVEVISGTTFESFLRDRVFNPLGMHETAFAVAEDDMHRFAALYMWGKGGELRLDQGFRTTFGYRRLENEKDFISPIGTPSGGGGLVSTLGDYMSFCKMLLNGGRGVGGKRAQILSPMTVDFMRKNHLDGDMTDMGEHASNFLGMNRKGVGFGLGFSVVVDSVAQPVVRSEGECAWGGAASTFFWLDFKQDLACVFMTQLMPSSSYDLRRQLRALVNSAIVCPPQ